MTRSVKDWVVLVESLGLVPWLFCALAILLIVFAYVAGVLASQKAQSNQEFQANLPFGPNQVSTLNLSVTLPATVTAGDSGLSVMLVSVSGSAPATGLFVEATLTSTENCTAMPGDFTRQAMPPTGRAQEYNWAWTAKVPGQCLFTYKTEILDKRGIYQTATFSYREVEVRKPWDFSLAFQLYGVPLLGLLGVIVSAVISGIVTGTIMRKE